MSRFDDALNRESEYQLELGQRLQRAEDRALAFAGIRRALEIARLHDSCRTAYQPGFPLYEHHKAIAEEVRRAIRAAIGSDKS